MIKLPTKYFKLNIIGEAHSPRIVIKIKSSFDNACYNPLLLEQFLNRRKPHENFETKRVDSDLTTIVRGIRNNKIKNNIKLIVKNDNTSLNNYKIFNSIPRPGHADFARIKKHGSILARNTDIYSGRMTIGYVIGGAFAKMALPNSLVSCEIVKVFNETDPHKFKSVINEIASKGDSTSAVIKITIKNTSVGLGDHNYFTTDCLLSSLLFKVPGVKAVSFGNNFDDLDYCGTTFNDVIINNNGETKTNHCGGITSGLTNGNDIVIYVYARPASSIKQSQKTYNLSLGKMDQLNIKGSHDSFYQQRMLVVIESMCYIGIYDLIQREKRSRHK